VVLSHPDIDHYNALPGLLQKFSVGEIAVSPLMFRKDAYAVRVLRNAIDEHGVSVREVQAGDRLVDDDGCVVEVLYPRQQDKNLPQNVAQPPSVVWADSAQPRAAVLQAEPDSNAGSMVTAVGVFRRSRPLIERSAATSSTPTPMVQSMCGSTPRACRYRHLFNDDNNMGKEGIVDDCLPR
jgi:hypothetical protein